jgi:hypothetical protein
MSEEIVVEQVSFTVPEFCARNRISHATFYKLRKANRGPRTMMLGNAIRITADAEKDWQRARVEETAELVGSAERRAASRTSLNSARGRPLRRISSSANVKRSERRGGRGDEREQRGPAVARRSSEDVFVVS